jgi:hypothetical protein
MADTDGKLLAISRRYQTRAETAQRPRRQKNDENWQAYRGEQDFSHKAEFQSRETTPSFPIAVDHIVGTFERALTDSDDWLLSENVGPFKGFLEPEVITGLTKYYGERLYQPGNHAETGYGIQTLVGDSVKRGIMEPRVVLKVYPVLVRRRFVRLKKVEPDIEQGALPAYELVGKELEHVEEDSLRIAVDVVPWDDYLRDPSPACRYEIHRTRRQLHELLANPEYDQAVVKTLIGQANDSMRKTRDLSDGERATSPDPYEVDVYEAWGDVIDEQSGEVLHSNVFWAWCNDQVLREPTPNPFWDGTSPFITSHLIRTPGSNESKALADHAVPMWRATNELVNLLLDGAYRAAWGVGQVRPDLMESPEEIADGMPQGYVAVLKPNVPQGQKFYERVDNGEAPQLSLEQLNRLEGYINEALATPDTKLGQLPDRATKATEIVQAMQSSGSLYESFAARYEDTVLEPLFEKMWKLILQYTDSFVEDELVAILGLTNTIRLEQMTPAERFAMCHKVRFRVRGLRGLAARERTFNKSMILVNLLNSNQQFADHFGQFYSYEKLWETLIRGSGNDPKMLELDDEEETEPDTSGDAGGQLNPALAGGTGASQPNIEGDLAGQRGEQSAFAPNNPATGAALSQ